MTSSLLARWRNAQSNPPHRDRPPVRSYLRMECLEDRVVPSTFTVTTTLDELTAGDAKLSLREALVRANVHAGADTIVLPAVFD